MLLCLRWRMNVFARLCCRLSTPQLGWARAKSASGARRGFDPVRPIRCVAWRSQRSPGDVKHGQSVYNACYSTGSVTDHTVYRRFHSGHPALALSLFACTHAQSKKTSAFPL
jgi:hypothetical protein